MYCQPIKNHGIYDNQLEIIILSLFQFRYMLTGHRNLCAANAHDVAHYKIWMPKQMSYTVTLQ